jgi:alpha-methylacyl-CoA racemase
MTALPLSGVKVLDLSTLLPGPLTSLFLAEAGAEVIKLERPGRGDEMRGYEPKFGDASANYAVLNRGKRAFAADFKDPVQKQRVLELAAEADIVLEQFRPGVADRLGLGFADLSAVNPGLIYCSISGYGSSGGHAGKAGHDLNYLGDSGLLGTVVDDRGQPALPVTVMADIAGGTYPALVNILLALRLRDATGEGQHIEVSMAHNLQVLAYGYFASHQAGAGWPKPGEELLTGGSPRYHLYRTADDRFIACAALEQKFWARLLELLEIGEDLLDETGREGEAIAALTRAFRAHDSAHWHAVLDDEDVCTTVVATWDEAVDTGIVVTDGPDRVTTPDGSEAISTLVSPITPGLRREAGDVAYPTLDHLGEASPWETTTD